MNKHYAIETLDWDSKFFGYKVGKIVIKDSLNFNNSSFIEAAKNYKLVYVFSKNEIFETFIKLVDKKVTFTRKIENEKLIQESSDYIRSFNPLTDSLSELLELAYESGIYSRFNVDTNFSNNEFKRLYKEWLISSINKSIALDVYIYIGESKNITGFISLAAHKNEVSEIGLIAVRASERGKGIARKLINKVICQSKIKNFKKIEVATQIVNFPAISLYENSGFKEKHRVNIYHYWTL